MLSKNEILGLCAGLTGICVLFYLEWRREKRALTEFETESKEMPPKKSKRIVNLQYLDKFESEDQFLRILDALKGDVVCVTSISKGMTETVVNRFSQYSHFEFVEIPRTKIVRKSEEKFLFGNAVFSRFPISKVQKFSIVGDRIFTTPPERIGPHFTCTIDDHEDSLHLVIFSPSLESIQNNSWQLWPQMFSQINTRLVPRNGVLEAEHPPFLLVLSFIFYIKQPEDSETQCYRQSAILTTLYAAKFQESSQTDLSGFWCNYLLPSPNFPSERLIQTAWSFENPDLEFALPVMADLIH